MNWQGQPELVYLFNVALYMLKGIVVELPGIFFEKIKSEQPGNVLFVVFAMIGMWWAVSKVIKILAAGTVLLVGYEVVTRVVIHA